MIKELLEQALEVQAVQDNLYKSYLENFKKGLKELNDAVESIQNELSTLSQYKIGCYKISIFRKETRIDGIQDCPYIVIDFTYNNGGWTPICVVPKFKTIEVNVRNSKFWYPVEINGDFIYWKGGISDKSENAHSRGYQGIMEMILKIGNGRLTKIQNEK